LSLRLWRGSLRLCLANACIVQIWTPYRFRPSSGHKPEREAARFRHILNGSCGCPTSYSRSAMPTLGRTSAPRWPQAGHTKSRSRSDSRIYPGQQSASITVECAHLWSQQNTRRRGRPDCRICLSVISCSQGMARVCQESYLVLNMPFGIGGRAAQRSLIAGATQRR